MRDTRLSALLLGTLLAIGALPSLGSAQVARIRLLTPDPIPVTRLTPVVAPPTSRSARVSAGSASAPTTSQLVFTTPSGGSHSASLLQSVASGRRFRTAVIEVLRDGRVYETITLSDVYLSSIISSSSGRGAEDEVVLAFGSFVSTSGRRDLQILSP